MMSCCGCASRVLKLQSEIRSWKTRLGDEKREKKMMLRWMLVVFGYDVQVELDKDTHVVHLQATENKEAMSKAIIKSVIGREEDRGVMLMDVKLEAHEYYEPFEEPDVPDFPILEINSMATSTQQPQPQLPLLNTGGGGIATFSHLMSQPQQHYNDSQQQQAMSITTPIEIVASSTTDLSTVNDNLLDPEQVLYIAGNLEEGATLEGPNGQSYIIVRAANNEHISVPMDYSTIVSDESSVIGDVYFGDALQQQSVRGNINNALLHYPALPKPAQPPPIPIIKSEPIDPLLQFPQVAENSTSKKTTAVHSPKSSMKTSLKRKASDPAEMDIMIKSVSSKAPDGTTGALTPGAPSLVLQDDSKRLRSTSLPANNNKRGSFGLTLREKAEIYVIQRARAVVEKLPNATGFRCTACTTSRVFPTIEYATGHAKTHFESKPYKCDFCHQLFTIQKELLNHRKTVHPKSNRATSSHKVSESIHCKKSANPISCESAGPTPPRQSFSGTTQIANNSTTSSSSTISSTKTVTVQPPFDKKLISGPINVSNEVLAAIMGAGARVTFSSSNNSNSDNYLRNLSRL